MDSEDSGKGGSKKVFNKYSFLGILIHGLLDSFLKNQWDLSQFDIYWEKLFKKGLAERGISDVDLPNIKYNLPYYIVKKNQALELFKSLEFWQDCRIESEAELDGEIIYGSADIIEFDSLKNRIRITDLKTGPALNIVDGSLEGPKIPYLTQLKTYGLHYWTQGYSSGNIKLRLLELSGGQTKEFSFTESEYSNHLEYLHSLLSTLNSSIKSNNYDELASPNKDTCRFCPFNMSCGSLHYSLKSEVLEVNSFLILDEINTEFDDLNEKINITTGDGLKSLHRIPKEDYAIIKKEVQIGVEIFINGLYQVQDSNIKYWTKYTNYGCLSQK